MKPEEAFSRFAHFATDNIGRPAAFIFVILVITVWLILGPFFHYSLAWRTAIDTIFSGITFLLVILLQHSQNHDTRAIQMKLDELIHSQARAANDLIEIEKLSETEVETIREEQNEARKQAGDLKPEPIADKD